MAAASFADLAVPSARRGVPAVAPWGANSCAPDELLQNRRGLGFDNAHGFHHRHFMGKVEAVRFQSYEATMERFQREWLATVHSMWRIK